MADKTLKERIYEVLKNEFPTETVDVSDGYRNNIHIIVVSNKFDQYEDEKTKQEYLWAILEDAGLSEQELSNVSLLLPYSPKQLK